MFDRSAIKYLIKDNKKSVSIFYLVIAIVLICIFALKVFLQFEVGISASDDFKGGASGLELASVIFLYVAGLCSFRQPFCMLLQNGYSRKAIWANAGITSVILAAFMATVDSVVGLVATVAFSGQSYVEYATLLDLIYPAYFTDMAAPLKLLLSIVILTMAYLAVFSFGYFISVMYYRMSKAVKIFVSISVPVLLFWIFPIVDVLLLGGRITITVMDVFSFLAGRSGGENPLIAMASSTVAALIFTVLGYLLSRKAVLKD